MAKEGISSLVVLGATHEKPVIRSLSAHGMGSSGDFSVLFVLSTMTDDRDELVRAEVMHSLGALNHPHASGLLKSALSDNSWRVRAAAADSIGVIGTEQSDLLTTLMESEDNWWVRYRVGEALSKLGHPAGSAEEVGSKSRLKNEDPRFSVQERAL
jgi:HEAT repeat protein